LGYVYISLAGKIRFVLQKRLKAFYIFSPKATPWDFDNISNPINHPEIEDSTKSKGNISKGNYICRVHFFNYEL